MPNLNQPLVTIAIPTYNRANSFLRTAIECALAQTYPNLEIVISNNCSTDNTEDVIKSYNDSRIRYFKQKKNIGPNANFNSCLQQANGKYFLMLLDDDLIDSDFISSCMDCVQGKTNIGLIRTGTRVIDGNDNILVKRENPAAGLSYSDFFFAWFDNQITLYVCSTPFSTNALRETGGFHSKHELFQDVIAETKIIAKYDRIDVHDIKASFRMHEENWGNSTRVTAWAEDALDLLDIICTLAPEKNDELRKRGMSYFCKKIYTYTSRLNGFINRMETYFKINQLFNRELTPYKFIYDNEIKPPIRQLKNKFF